MLSAKYAMPIQKYDKGVNYELRIEIVNLLLIHTDGMVMHFKSIASLGSEENYHNSAYIYRFL
jgi:hypothetical protein